MTNHPIHLHGHEFEVTGTDGGWTNPSSRWPEVTTDVAVGQMRAIEFIANEPGDWAFHCHKSHHTMNAMGHDVPTMIGVDHRGVVEKINRLVPDYMVMGERGMADMGEMEMPIPDNTLPMMTGTGPFGPIEMGGMFTDVEGARRTCPQRLQGPGLVSAPGRNRCLRMEGGNACGIASGADPGAGAVQCKEALVQTTSTLMELLNEELDCRRSHSGICRSGVRAWRQGA